MEKMGSSRLLTYKNKKIIEFLYASETLLKGKRVLDAGGRDGLIIDRLNGAEWKVILDLNKNELEKAKTETKIVADLGHMPFMNDSFDLAIFSEVLEHVENPQRVVMELGRTCRSVVMTTPNNSIFRRVLWNIRRKGELSSVGHVWEYSPREIECLFYNAGFELVVFKGIGFIVKKPKFLRFFEVIPYLSSKVLMQYKKPC